MQIAPSALEPAPYSEASGPPRGPDGSGRARRRRKPQRGITFLALVVLVAIAGASGVLRTAKQQVDRISRVPGLTFSPADPNIENFLLVGSDSRVGEDPNSPDFGAIGDATAVTGNRSDTIMILRRDKNTGRAALLSLPRDLWVYIPSRGNESRINAAYQDGPQALIDTVKDTLKIPVHHYVEIDFQGFKSLVDAIGGVRVCADTPIRDVHTGLNVTTSGCHILDGVQGLAYARSRHFETLNEVTGVWTEDPSSDLGRIKRQQQFVNTALQGALAKVKGDPLSAGDVLVSSTGALKLDSGLDVLGAASALRDAVGSGLAPFSPPVRGKTIRGNAVLLFADGAQAYIDYFSGLSNTPPVPA